MDFIIVGKDNKYFIRSNIGLVYDIDDIYWMYCDGNDEIFNEIKNTYNISENRGEQYNICFLKKEEAHRFINEFLVPIIIMKRLTKN